MSLVLPCRLLFHLHPRPARVGNANTNTLIHRPHSLLHLGMQICVSGRLLAVYKLAVAALQTAMVQTILPLAVTQPAFGLCAGWLVRRAAPIRTSLPLLAQLTPISSLLACPHARR